MLLWEGRQSSAQRACYLPCLSRYPFIHLGREEQARVKCLAQGHNTRAFTGFEPTTLGSWVRNSTAELRVPLKKGKGTLYLTENRSSRNKMWCTVDNINYVCHICAKGFSNFRFKLFTPPFLLPCTWVWWWEKNMCTEMTYPPDPFTSFTILSAFKLFN